MAGVKISKIIKRSISLSPLVNQWAEDMAAKRGFTNFSAFIADLVCRSKEATEVKNQAAAVFYPPHVDRSALMNEPVSSGRDQVVLDKVLDEIFADAKHPPGAAAATSGAGAKVRRRSKSPTL